MSPTATHNVPAINCEVPYAQDETPITPKTNIDQVENQPVFCERKSSGRDLAGQYDSMGTLESATKKSKASIVGGASPQR